MTLSVYKDATPARFGAAYSGLASGCTVPTSAAVPAPGSAAIATAGYDAWGKLTEDGITLKIDGEEVSLPDWDGDPFETWTKKQTVELTVHPHELLRKAVAEEYFGAANVTADANGHITSFKIKNSVMPNRSYIFDVALADTRLGRLVIPCGKFKPSTEIAFNADNSISGEATITCFADANGVKAAFYVAEPSTGGSSANNG